MATINRRELIGSLLGISAATLAGCSKNETAEIEGELLSPDFETGHRLRDHGASIAAIREWNEIPVVIVGGGIAGLTAGWRLQRAGYSDFVLLELEDRVGGTSSSGSRESFQFPWGAHYITTPLPENIPLIEFLQEMGVVEDIAPDGNPIIAEEYLCRDPEERIYAEGTWREGLFPAQGASQDDLDQVADFHEKMLAWALKRDANGKRWFALPIAHCSDDPEPRSLDQISMLQWMQEQGWDSPRLRWYVDYACRDDYGLSIDRTSAWAGILYYASRLRRESRQSQDVITWPSGNGRIVEYLRDKLKSRIQSRKLVYRIKPSTDPGRDARCEISAYDKQRDEWIGYRAKRVIFAAPQFIAKHVIDRFREGAVVNEPPFRYSWWLVANVHLRDRPHDAGFPVCWDNIFYESKSLGYVVSTHQSGRDHGPTVWTWYYPFADATPRFSREDLLKVKWADWVQMVLTDLAIAHPEIRSLVTRVDIMRWGHAMVEPYTGFVWSDARQAAAKPDRNIHFAHSDLSGIALMEEAFYHGVRAADEVLGILGDRI